MYSYYADRTHLDDEVDDIPPPPPPADDVDDEASTIESVSSFSTKWSSSSSMRVEDRLNQYGQMTQLKKEALRKQQEDQLKESARLHLVTSPSSRQLQDHQPVEERLYQRAFQLPERPLSERLHDDLTGQKLFEPMIDKTSELLAAKSRDPSMPIEEILHHRGKEYEKRAKMREHRMSKMMELQRESSKLNVTSQRLVKEKEIIYGETSKDRLNRGIGSVKKSTLDIIDKPSFKPKINQQSKEIVQNSFGHLYASMTDQVPEKKIEVFYAGDVSAASSSEAFNGPSSPSNYYYTLGDGVYTLAPGASSGGERIDANDPVSAVHYRSQSWMKEKARKLERERIEQQKEMEKQCSFKPKLAENGSFAASVPSSSAAASSASIADRQLEWMRKR